MKESINTTNDKKKKAGKRARIRMRRIKRFLLFLLVVTGVIIFARSSFFVVEKIDVTGNKKYSKNELILQSGLKPGNNVFKMLGEKPKNLISFRFNDLEQEVYNSMPYIKSVSIRPALPATIRIKVEERTPFAVLDKGGKNLLIDKEGYVLEVLDNKSELLKKYFKIIGISVDSYKPGQAVKFKDSSALEDLISFCDLVVKNDKDLKPKLYEKITKVDLSDISSITVEYDSRVTVRFGDLEDADYQISVFKHLLVNNISAKQKGTLDFTKSSNPYFVPAD